MGKQTLDTNKTIAKGWVWEGGSVTAVVCVCMGGGGGCTVCSDICHCK